MFIFSNFHILNHFTLLTVQKDTSNFFSIIFYFLFSHQIVWVDWFSWGCNVQLVPVCLHTAQPFEERILYLARGGAASRIIDRGGKTNIHKNLAHLLVNAGQIPQCHGSWSTSSIRFIWTGPRPTYLGGAQVARLSSFAGWHVPIQTALQKQTT